jgi:hypothetical protein
LPTVIGNVDYTQFERLLRRMDELLRVSGAERQFLELSLAALHAEHAQKGTVASAAEIRHDQT